ncbi:AMP-binding protein [Pseudoxanthomonas daejeonensis]|uniref:AMP-binding protein n=1 Tax=Pseudoxanthomonas daejeonensis TaxID=266062 RepID=UPI001F541186|nr:AMP-binding protein [Pseudoxanthomonas daejeonensis]UNK56449.1 AMP-binding protein [Pseudoxanthomonas daejeonensis]
MAFWELERHPPHAPALVDAKRTISYSSLATQADAMVATLPHGERTLGFLAFANNIEAVSLCLGALRSGHHVPLLLQADMDPALLAALAAHYRPDWLALAPGTAVPEGYRPHATHDDLVIHVAVEPFAGGKPHPDLALLLSTSGSTGSSKLVRLSYAGLAANAASIVAYLGLRATDRAITTLPLAYSFGMSILNSHLEAGASMVLTDESMVGRRFWEIAQAQKITSLSGVPATFEMLRRVGLERFHLDRLRMLTQAGGRLRDALIEEFLDASERLGLEFFVMYGQTEAGPRISYVPSGTLRSKIGSIGIAVPGGELELDATSGELVFTGQNVMLGYAARREDLAAGDEAGGVLRTGDLARRDADGYFYITGRAKRFVKISGNRVNLDEVESMLAGDLHRAIACSGSDDDLVVFVPGQADVDQAVVRQLIQQRYKLFPGHVRLKSLPALPLLGTGKVDYQALRALCENTET